MSLLLRYCQSSTIRMGLIAIASFGFAWPALGEGSQQLGSGDQGLNVYLFEYDASNNFVQGTNRALQVNVENANEVINVSLCGWSTSDDLAIEVFRPSGTEINYTTQVAAGSPGSFSSSAGSSNGAWLLSSGNARTSSQTTLCNSQSSPNQPATNSPLSNPVRFIAPEAGTYEIRLYNDSQSSTSSNNVFTYFDITVTPNTSTNPDPRSNNGQLWATSWAFNAGNTFGTSGGYDADLYIRTPGARPSTEFIWQLDLNNFAPQRHEIIANGIGLDAPNSRSSALGSSGASYTRDFPIYVSPPNTASTILPILPEPAPPTVSNLRFIDNANQDSSISPNSTVTVQDSGFFRFDTDIAGTYKITIDTNQNGSYDNGDRILFGNTSAGSNSVQWDGRGLNNAVLPSGTYTAQIDVGLGEYHFVAFDAETSGGGSNNGLSIWKWNSSTSSRSAVTNYWDDTNVGGSSNLSGGTSGTAAGTHTWGSFSSGGIGDTNYIDTWVFGDPRIETTSVIIADVDENDFGDAPDTYGTDVDISVGGTPASHLIGTDIYLGLTPPDAETDGQPTADSDGDDSDGSAPDDEDGITSFPALIVSNNSYSLTATVNNNTVNPVNVYAWIDFDRDGEFDEDERAASATVGANSSNTPVTLSWANIGTSGPDINLGDSYIRVRVSTEDLDLSTETTGRDDASIGASIDGEVEDYPISVVSNNPSLILVKRVTAIGSNAVTGFVDGSGPEDNDSQWPTNYLQGAININSVQPGEEIEFTIYFLANGNVGLTKVNICDLIPTNTTYVAGSGTIAFGTTESAWTDLRDAGDEGEYIAPNTTVTNASVPGIGLCRSDRDTTQDLPANENPNGLVWVEIDKITSPLPSGQEGYVQFRVQVQ